MTFYHLEFMKICEVFDEYLIARDWKMKNDTSTFRSGKFCIRFAFEGDIEATSASMVLKRRGCAATRASSAMGHMEKEYKPRRDRYSFDIRRSFSLSLFKRTSRVTIHIVILISLSWMKFRYVYVFRLFYLHFDNETRVENWYSTAKPRTFVTELAMLSD